VKPSEVIVLSESIPSLPLLLDLESMSILEGRGTTKPSTLRIVEGGSIAETGAEDPRRIKELAGLS